MPLFCMTLVPVEFENTDNDIYTIDVKVETLYPVILMIK